MEYWATNSMLHYLHRSIGASPDWLVNLTADGQGGYEATQNPAIGVSTIPFIYLYFGFYVACWSTVAPMCK
jgi:hypothetical protein